MTVVKSLRYLDGDVGVVRKDLDEGGVHDRGVS